MPIDRVTLQILANHCGAAAESMAQTLYRTAHSTFVKETEDFTTGLATPDGKTFASPADLGATWFVGLDYDRAFKLIDHYEEGDTRPTSTCGSRSSTRASWCASRSGISTTPTSAARCRRACRAPTPRSTRKASGCRR